MPSLLSSFYQTNDPTLASLRFHRRSVICSFYKASLPHGPPRRICLLVTMLLFVLHPTHGLHSPRFAPSIYFLKVETLSRQTTSGPRVHGEVDKHRPEPSRPA